jgi:hypothetical protein
LVERQEHIVLSIVAWSAWAPGIESAQAWNAWAAGDLQPGREGNPALPFVDPLMRRRLSRLARMALHVAHVCTQTRAAERSVFASRHGELQRTVGMLHDLGRNTELSPTDFSLSVHNAIAGVHSIVRRDRSPSVAVAAGEESFAYGLIEAAGQWQLDTDRSVLFVYADEPAPTEYRRFVSDREMPHALALLIGSGGDTALQMRRVPGAGQGLNPEMQSLAFVRGGARKGGEMAGWGGQHEWGWSVTPDVA